MNRELIIEKITILETAAIGLEEATLAGEIRVDDMRADISNIESKLLEGNKLLEALNRDLEYFEELLLRCDTQNDRKSKSMHFSPENDD